MCVNTAITKEPIEYSLMVDSKEAVVLSVLRYDLNFKYPLDVLKVIKTNMRTFETWIQERATQLMMNEF